MPEGLVLLLRPAAPAAPAAAARPAPATLVAGTVAGTVSARVNG